MNKEINLAKKNEAIENLSKFKVKSYYQDIKLTNVHLIELNELIGLNLFKKNDIYVYSLTLWELMQPIGKKGKHHYHGLEACEIYDVLSNITKPFIIFKTYENRIALVIELSILNTFYLIIIEQNSGLLNDRFANINKLISIYPRNNINKKIEKLNKTDILYIKK